MQLNVININGKLLVDSREVADMTSTRHDNLIAKIDAFVKVLNTNLTFKVSDFFIEGTYQDATGRNLKKYDCSRKGCDMVANKMSGEKGILFSAAYVTKFEEMEHRQQNKHSIIPQSLPEALRLAADLAEKNETLLLENTDLKAKTKYLDKILKSKGTVTVTQIAEDYGMTAFKLNNLLHEEGIQYKVNKQWILYHDHKDKGYTKSETIDITRSNGDPDVTMNTRWTQKGRLLIHETLTKLGIVPYMDREEVTN